jgi:hypothetical protein
MSDKKIDSMLRRWFGYVALMALAGCGWLSSSGPANDAGMAVRDVVCVLDHDQDPVLTIISECNLASDAIAVVQQILASSHAAEARAAAEKAPDAGPGK